MSTIFIQHVDGTVETLDVMPGPSPNQVVLAQAPRFPLSLDPTNYARSTFVFVKGSASQRERAFLLTEKSFKSQLTSEIKAINYDSRYYANDTDSPVEDKWPWGTGGMAPPSSPGVWTPYTTPWCGVDTVLWTGTSWLISSAWNSVAPWDSRLWLITDPPIDNTFGSQVYSDTAGDTWVVSARNGSYIILGDGNSSSGRILVSNTNGVTWTLRNLAGLSYISSIANNSITTWVIGGYNLFGVSTDNGVNWQAISSAAGDTRGMLWDGTQFVAACRSTGTTSYLSISTSVDGLSWVNHPTGIVIGDLIADSGGQAIAFGNGSYMIGGWDKTPLGSDTKPWILKASSPSGLWTKLSSITFDEAAGELPTFITYANSTWLVLTNHGHIKYSYDNGESWYTDTFRTSLEFRHAAWNGAHWLITAIDWEAYWANPGTTIFTGMPITPHP